MEIMIEYQLLMRHIRIHIAYDGTGFSGWQIQPGEKTIQGTIEDALRKITGNQTRLTGSGRTDAGVHALHQVASFSTTSTHPPEVFVRALNALLPPEIRVLKADEPPPGFHPRYSVKAKRYFYLLDLSVVQSPFIRRYAWHLPRNLDLLSIRTATTYLLGSHDFAAFSGAGSSVTTTIRELITVDLVEKERMDILFSTLEGRFVKIVFEGTGFLRHMVRNMVGTLVEIGLGKMGVDQIKTIINSRDRRLAGPTAPAKGLFLERVIY